MAALLRYLAGYAPELQQQIQRMLDDNKLHSYIEKKYPQQHTVASDKALREFVQDYKQRYLKKSSPLSKVVFDNKIHVVHNALGLHSYVRKSHGGKTVSKNEIRIGAVFKQAPEAFLQMIVVHELAHLKEREHNKAFYKLCQHMLPDYFQLEFDLRVYLTWQETLV